MADDLFLDDDALRKLTGFAHKARQVAQLRKMGDAPASKPGWMPRLLQRYFELWERHPQRDDPLLQPVRYRCERDDIPF